MKVMKKLAAFVAIIAMVATMALPAFANELNSPEVDGDNTTTTVSEAANKNSGSFSITMQSSEAGHTFRAYRIFDGGVNKEGKLSDISWAAGVNTDGIAAKLAEAGLKNTIGSGTDAVTLDLSKAADVAKALGEQSDDDAVMIKVADVFFDAKGNEAGNVSAADSNGNYVISDLVAGYYLVTDEYSDPDNVAAGAETLSRNVLAVVGDVTAQVKNTKPQIEKKILDPNPVDANEAGIGETVVYQIKGKVPNYTGYDKYFYVINDTLSGGLTFNADSVVVTVGGVTQTAGTDYVLYTGDEADDPYTFQVAFKNIMDKTIAADIVVTYNAVVNENAVIGKSGNPNEVDLTYSNNPNDSSKGNPSDNPKPDENHPTGVTPKDKTITYVAELDLTKYFDKVDTANYLKGATFTLTGTSNVPRGKTADKYVADDNGTFYKLKDNTFTTSVPHGDIKRSDGTVAVASNEADYASTTQKYKLTSETEYEYVTKDVFMQGTSNDNGKIIFKGLGAGTYTLKETVTPSGYNTAEDITFTITVTVPETITTGTETATWKSNNDSVTVDGTTAIYATDVIDNSGSTLPSTGGMGTTLFYVIGGLLIVAAAIVIISKRRVQEG